MQREKCYSVDEDGFLLAELHLTREERDRHRFKVVDERPPERPRLVVDNLEHCRSVARKQINGIRDGLMNQPIEVAGHLVDADVASRSAMQLVLESLRSGAPAELVWRDRANNMIEFGSPTEMAGWLANVLISLAARATRVNRWAWDAKAAAAAAQTEQSIADCVHGALEEEL